MDELSVKFGELFGQSDTVARFFCPGRVNLIGEHIDYLGGLVMPTAISLGITALIRPIASPIIRIHSTDFDETVEFNLTTLPDSKQNYWSDFVLGVVLHLKQKGIELGGCDILIDSNLPKGSGLSSSAALEVLCYFMFHSIFGGTRPDGIQLAIDCQRIENDFIGVSCGIMDQFAVANGKADSAIVLNCNSLEYEFVPLDLGRYSLLIINTNRPRTLAKSAYNQRRSECDEALRIIFKNHPIENLVDATLNDLDLISDPVLKKRTRHAITEQVRVRDSVAALRSKDLVAFGKLMGQSHASLRDDYEVSCAELDFVVDQLQSDPACLGVRMTGAGFGGCCIALICSDNAQELTERLNGEYNSRFGFAPSLHDCKTSNGAHRIT